MIPIILLLAAFCLNNARRAQLKNLNVFAWVSFTVIAFFAGMFAAFYLLIQIISFKIPEFRPIFASNDIEKIRKFLDPILSENGLLYSALLIAGAYGGYLLVRYLIEKQKPGKAVN